MRSSKVSFPCDLANRLGWFLRESAVALAALSGTTIDVRSQVLAASECVQRVPWQGTTPVSVEINIQERYVGSQAKHVGPWITRRVLEWGAKDDGEALLRTVETLSACSSFASFSVALYWPHVAWGGPASQLYGPRFAQQLVDRLCASRSRGRFVSVEFVNGPHTTEETPFSFELAPLRSVRHFVAKNVKAVSDLSGLAGVPSVKLSWCKNVKDLSPLRNARKVCLNSCNQVGSVVPLSRVDEVSIVWCNRVAWHGFDALRTVRKLTIGDSHLGDVSRFGAVQDLTLFKCVGVGDVSGLSTVSSLMLCSISGVREYAPLATVPNLVLKCCDVPDLDVLRRPARALPYRKTLTLKECSSNSVRVLDARLHWKPHQLVPIQGPLPACFAV